MVSARIPSAPTGLDRRAERGQSGVVAGFLADLGYQLGVGDVAVGTDHDDGAGKQARHRSVRECDAVVLPEAVAERRRGDDVLDALCATESLLRERQIVRYAQH